MTTISGPAAVSPPVVPPLEVRDATSTTEPPPSAPAASAAPRAPAAEPLADRTLAALVAEQSSTPLSVTDLRGQDLRQFDLRSVDLRGADLSGANLSGLDLSDLDLSGARLDGANLAGATLKDVKLDNVSAIGADLSDATLINTTIDGADFSQASFDRAFIGKEAKQYIAVWDVDRYQISNNVRLDGASFRGAHLQGVSFRQASAVGADFSNLHADVSGFRASNLQGANFDAVSGRKLSFAESDLSGAALTKSSLKHLDINSTTLTGTRFAGSSLNGVGLSFTNLSVADLTGLVREARTASFNNVNLDGIDFSGFDFSGAHFNGDPTTWTTPDHRDVAGAGPSMTGTRFDGAKFEAAWFQGLDTGAASFAGATFNAIAQGKSANSLAGVAGVGDWSLETFSRFLALRGISLPMPAGPTSSAAPARSRVEDPIQPVRKGPGLITGAKGPEAAIDQTASLALETLKSINAQIRDARLEARSREDRWESAALASQPGQDRTLAVV